MKTSKYSLLAALLLLSSSLWADAPRTMTALREHFVEPTEESAPWIFWYWMNGAVTKEGITADLEAMKEIGLEGTYLMPIRDSSRVQFMPNSVLQGTDKWWEMVGWSMQEADRLGLKMGLHICDGFALAGGPWITPEMSMQKVVYSMQTVAGGQYKSLVLDQPPFMEGYYEDIACLALPIRSNASTDEVRPRVTCSTGEDVSFLPDGRGKLVAKTPIWVQYAFDEPFTAASMTVSPSGTNFQALRWRVAVSDDGENFRDIKTCEPARRGWQDTDAANTYSLPETTARYFRFYWTPEGTEPGAEDLDAAKWKADLSVRKIRLSALPLIENFEGKTGLVWRLSPRQSSEDIAAASCVALEDVIDLSARMNAEGVLTDVRLPRDRQWLILRLGHTSTGHRNDTGGGAKGLECDKFNPAAVQLQFDNWFGAAYKHIDPALLRRVLVRLHSDSWECGSQNWTANFLEEFKARRQYDLKPYLALYAGIPLVSAETSEAVLYDIRQTIVELIHDVFFKTLADLAHDYGCQFSSECVAPTMLSDGLLHYDLADLPMGEYWLDSPTHDKPNDMFDAVSGAHIYGKNLVQAEGFTQLRALWKEYPGMLKQLGDFNLAFGMNKLFFHVFCLHPFPGKYPGMTLDGIGLYMHGNQTWWPFAGAWVKYIKRCQTMLQYGHPVVDIAVFTGENLPSRSVLPDKLVGSLPGLFGPERVASEAARVKNEGQPVHSTSVSVTASKNMITADLWTDPLRGYKYDCINRDALLRLARVRDGRMVLPGGASYKVLVLPIAHPMAPDANYLSYEVLQKIKSLQDGGVVVMLPPTKPTQGTSYSDVAQNKVSEADYSQLAETVWAKAAEAGTVLPYVESGLDSLGLTPDIRFFDTQGRLLDDIAWNHRSDGVNDIWFVSNQGQTPRRVLVQLRESDNNLVELWQPLTGEVTEMRAGGWDHGRVIHLSLDKNGSVFIVMRGTPGIDRDGNAEYRKVARSLRPSAIDRQLLPMKFSPWQIKLRRTDTTLQVKELFDWSEAQEPAVRYYSGVADYRCTFDAKKPKLEPEDARYFLQFEHVDVVAKVTVNGEDCGTIWCEPYRVEVTKALKNGRNTLEISVANTWYNYTQAYNYGVVEDDNYWTNGRTWDYRARGSISDVNLQPSGIWGHLDLLLESPKQLNTMIQTQQQGQGR